MLKGPILSTCAIALLLLSLTAGVTRGSGATTFTQNFHDVTVTFPASPFFCNGINSTVTITYNGVFHETNLTSGEFWATMTLAGTFATTPVDPSQLSFTGHFAVWFGVSANHQNFVVHSIFNIHGTGSDGSTLIFHDTMHFSVSASGVIISFDKPSCG